jgi:hypothetical protein
MVRRTGFALLGFVIALWVGSPSPANAADHRDSPQVDEDVTTDITDIFMFRDPANPAMLVVTLNTHPLSDPKFSLTYHYNSNAVYRFRFHTNTTAVPTSQIDFVFSPYTTVNGVNSQTFTAYFPHGIVVQGPVTLGTVAATPPTPLITYGPQGIMIYAGPREDPFVFDLVGFNRFIAGVTPNFTGNDAFAGFNVNAIVVEVPISLIVGSAQQFGFWAVTYSQSGSPANLTQIDRMGNPAVNTAFISSAFKDAFNSGIPQNDAQNFAPIILKTLAGFNTPQANVAILASVAVPDTLKFDVTKPDGFPNGRRLQDRATDIELQLVTNNPSFTDGTGPLQAAKNYLTTFPYLGPPCQVQSQSGSTGAGDCAQTTTHSTEMMVWPTTP